MPVTITESVSLSASDGVTSLISKVITTTSSCTLIDYSTSFYVTTTPASLSLPVSPLQVVYIKNVGSTNNVIVTWTPNGGSSAVVQKLTPSSFMSFIQNATGQGITALSVQADAGTSYIEFVIGG